MSIDIFIRDDIKISQPDSGFRFGIDSVLLAWFATIKRGERIIDIGSGSGIISALLAKMKNAANITAVELQPEMYAHLTHTIELCGLENIITPVLSDIRSYIPAEKFNMAVCNPPYRPVNIGKISGQDVEAAARFEQNLVLDDILAFCRRNLHYGGRLSISGDADRLAPIMSTCVDGNFQPKRLRFLHPCADKKAKIFLMECVYGGGVELAIEPPIYQGEGNLHEIYSNILQGDWI
jgi:tRNA1(Val) A37 N6-methylase TrmN6